MKLETQKFIAREGLVIVGILILSFSMLMLSFFLERKAYNLRSIINMHTVEIEGLGRFQIPGANKDIVENRIDLVVENSVRGLEQEYIDSLFKYEMDVFYRSNALLKFSEFSLNFSVLIFFLVYPFYLMVRFIIWAVRKLKQKNVPDTK